MVKRAGEKPTYDAAEKKHKSPNIKGVEHRAIWASESKDVVTLNIGSFTVKKDGTSYKIKNFQGDVLPIEIKNPLQVAEMAKILGKIEIMYESCIARKELHEKCLFESKQIPWHYIDNYRVATDLYQKESIWSLISHMEFGKLFGEPVVTTESVTKIGTDPVDTMEKIQVFVNNSFKKQMLAKKTNTQTTLALK